jgi:hypothetical protein
MSDGDDVKPAAAGAGGEAPATPSSTPSTPSGKPPLRERLSALFSEYGRIAVITYFTLSILTIIGFSIAFGIGLGAESAGGVFGAIAAGWVAAKATLPIRILITLGLTPIVAYVVNHRGRRAGRTPDEADEAPDEPTGGSPR